MSRDRRLRLEALAHLLLARVAIEIVPFRWLTRLFERAARKPELQDAAREAARSEVRRAIYQASSRLPGTTACFPRALAAQAMLRRRAVSTTLCCGAATSPDNGLKAHVWLQDDKVGITGHRASRGYRLLASYSAITTRGE